MASRIGGVRDAAERGVGGRASASRLRASAFGLACAAIAGLAERWAPELGQDVRHVEACATGTWIGHRAPRSAPSADVMALAEAVAKLLEIRPRDPTRHHEESGDAGTPAPNAQLTA